jgi:hypothetical protein
LQIDEIEDFLAESSIKREVFADRSPSYGTMKNVISRDYHAAESSDNHNYLRRLPKHNVQIIVPVLNKINRFISDPVPIQYPVFRTWYENNYRQVHKVEVEATKLINILISKSLEIKGDSFRINQEFIESINAFQGYIKIKIRLQF